jgi:hypothetical protein
VTEGEGKGGGTMDLREKIEAGIKSALKAGRKIDVGALRLTLSEIRSAEKEKRSPLDDEEVVRIIRSAVKKRKESIEMFRKGGRDDLVEKETAEVALLSEYLPAPFSAAELESLVEEGIAETEATSMRDLGRIMKWIMPRLEGKADGSEVSRLVKEKLSPPPQ